MMCLGTSVIAKEVVVGSLDPIEVISQLCYCPVAWLAQQAAEKGVLIEPGRVTFGTPDAPRNFYRLAFSSIDEQKIEPGIRILADLVRR